MRSPITGYSIAMPSPVTPDRSLLERWLKAAAVDSYVCEHCDNLHLSEVRSQEGVLDSRLIQESFGLLFTTELEIRPMALLAVAADLGRLNMEYPTLKIFLDIVDDATPQLVAASIFPGNEGLTQGQFNHFIAIAMQATLHLAEECLRLDYLFSEDGSTRQQPRSVLH